MPPGTSSISTTSASRTAPPGSTGAACCPATPARDVWTSYEPVAADPTYVDPASGWLANSNNTPFVATGAGDNLDPSGFSPLLGIETYMTNRAYRFRDCFAALGDREDQPRRPAAASSSTRPIAHSMGRRSWLARVLAVDPKGDRDVAAAQALLQDVGLAARRGEPRRRAGAVRPDRRGGGRGLPRRSAARCRRQAGRRRRR